MKIAIFEIGNYYDYSDIVRVFSSLDKFYTIPGFTRYEITKSGQVRHRKHKRILRRGFPSNGYAQIHLRSDVLKRQISKCIHQLMAITFMGDKPGSEYEISFLIKDRNNINLTNLEYKLIKDNKSTKTRTITYCIFCGKENPRSNKKYCSKLHRFLDTHTLLQCSYCGKKFYRNNCIIKGHNANPLYISNNVYCRRRCFYATRKREHNE